jgi:hypothetical protein
MMKADVENKRMVRVSDWLQIDRPVKVAQHDSSN